MADGKFDDISQPAHYAEGRQFEPIDVIADWQLNFDLGNVVKYVSRAGRKDGEGALKALRKALVYLEHEIRTLEMRGDLAEQLQQAGDLNVAQASDSSD